MGPRTRRSAEGRDGIGFSLGVVLAVASSLGFLAPVPAALAEPVACQRAIAREASKVTQAHVKALAKCEKARLQGKVPFATDCAGDAVVAAARAKAEARLAAKVGAACGGRNGTCDADDGGADADDALADIGWDLGTCPGFEGAGCTDEVVDCADVATCVACVSRIAVAQAAELAAGSAVGSVPGTALNRCQTTIVEATARFVAAASRALQTCRDAELKGAIVGPCPGGDPKTAAALAKARAARDQAICKACGGTDRACGGGDDALVAGIGFVETCPAVSTGGPTCGRPVASVEDLATCVGCVTDYKATCVDAVAVPGLAVYPAGCAQPAATATPTPTTTPTPTLTPTPTPTVTPPAGAAAIACMRTLVKETARVAQVRTRELAKCEEGKRKGQLPGVAVCADTVKVVTKLAKSERKLAQQIAKACGGRNRACGSADSGDDADLPLPEIGWEQPGCPGFETDACFAALADCNDVAGCVSCTSAGVVDQAIALAYAPTVPADPSTELGKCQLAIGRAVRDLVLARSNALRKCADATLRDRITGPCPDPGDGKAVAAFAKAEGRFLDRICGACGGGDGACGGGDDLAPSALGFPVECPGVQVPGGPACGGAIATLGDLVGCFACVTGFENECVDRIAVPSLRGYPAVCRAPTPTPTPTGVTPTPTGPVPTPTPGVCGNGIVQLGEDCDDGNTADCDECPSDCVKPPVQCPSTSVRYSQPVRLVRTDGLTLTSVLFCLAYPVGEVGLPGTGLVTGRLSGFSGVPTANDADNAVRVALLGQNVLDQVNVTVSFDLCGGEAPPPPGDFTCTVLSASNQGVTVDPTLVGCAPLGP